MSGPEAEFIPTQEYIKEMCALIQMTWSPEEREKRRARAWDERTFVSRYDAAKEQIDFIVFGHRAEPTNRLVDEVDG